jgi:hypothetical protein
MEKNGEIGDQSQLAGRPVYIWAGAMDENVPFVGHTELNRYFKEKQMSISYNIGPKFKHWFNDATVAGDFSRFCYNNLQADYSDFPYSNSLDFVNEGLYGKWD